MPSMLDATWLLTEVVTFRWLKDKVSTQKIVSVQSSVVITAPSTPLFASNTWSIVQALALDRSNCQTSIDALTTPAHEHGRPTG